MKLFKVKCTISSLFNNTRYNLEFLQYLFVQFSPVVQQPVSNPSMSPETFTILLFLLFSPFFFTICLSSFPPSCPAARFQSIYVPRDVYWSSLEQVILKQDISSREDLLKNKFLKCFRNIQMYSEDKHAPLLFQMFSPINQIQYQA